MSGEPINLKDKTFWERQVQTNTDPYGKAVVDAARQVMLSLDAQDDFEVAYKKMYGFGLSGFQAGCVASIIFKCHDRGDDFKTFWNQSWGVEMQDGAINPAIFTASEKGIKQ